MYFGIKMQDLQRIEQGLLSKVVANIRFQTFYLAFYRLLRVE